jgi:nicotinamidase-related amidase
MPNLELPVRYYRDFEPHWDYAYETLSLPLEETAFLLVDVNGDYKLYTPISEEFIAPALEAARQVGMRVAFVHNDLRLVADPGNIVFEIWGKTKGMGPEAWKSWKRGSDYAPEYFDFVRPRATEEPNFPKWVWSGFRDTFLDQHLRAHNIKTLICVGYSVRACFYGTVVDAVYNNYRVVVLRDSVCAPEQPDTEDADLPEGGWINRIMVRQIEHLIGYTSTSAEFVEACRAVSER